MEIEVITHSGARDLINVESYSALETFAILNNEHYILLGQNIYSCIDIKSIKPYQEADNEIK